MLMWSLRSMMVLMVLITAGCAAGTGQYGSAAKSIAVDRIFRSGPLPEEYRYFYNGVKSEPAAILGLSREYSLRSDFWTEINLDDRQMRDWRRFFVQSMTWYDDRSQGRMSYDGYRLSDQQGKTVGILYSRYGWIVIEFLPDNGILVHPPQPHAAGYSLWEDNPMQR